MEGEQRLKHNQVNTRLSCHVDVVRNTEFVAYLCEIPSLEASSLALEIVIVGTAAAATTSAVVAHPVAIVSTGIE